MWRGLFGTNSARTMGTYTINKQKFKVRQPQRAAKSKRPNAPNYSLRTHRSGCKGQMPQKPIRSMLPVIISLRMSVHILLVPVMKWSHTEPCRQLTIWTPLLQLSHIAHIKHYNIQLRPDSSQTQIKGWPLVSCPVPTVHPHSTDQRPTTLTTSYYYYYIS